MILCVFLCMYVCMYVCTTVYIYIKCICGYSRTLGLSQFWLYVCICICINHCVHAHGFTNVYIHTYITHTQTYLHTQMYRQTDSLYVHTYIICIYIHTCNGEIEWCVHTLYVYMHIYIYIFVHIKYMQCACAFLHTCLHTRMLIL
jgi:hypothetical protein